MAFNVTFGSQNGFDVDFQNSAQMQVNFRRETEFNAETAQQNNFNSEFEGGAQMNAAFLNGVGTWMPLGGNPGDLLAKKSEKDGDTEWITPADEVEEGNSLPVTSAAAYSKIIETRDELIEIIREIEQELETRTKMWFGTRLEYNALTWLDPDTCYCIEEGT